ncbi:MAG: 30S ribosomal protein S12 methylthiotransferase RimO [Bacteroidetes bacterium]|jgi:ribosomal protein S12 methylthiotransferase|nr:30S ribosomal protein S12 methylthiotransferase RimO [Bacteroidota bacterium]
MKTKPHVKPRVNVYTLGCSKNTFDSELLMGQLAAGAIDVVHEQRVRKNDTVVINTCGFIDNAKQESIDTILEFVDAKKAGKVGRVVVMGCLSERFKDDLTKEIPEVDLYFGSQELPNVVKALGADYKYELLGERLLTTPSHFAYLKISEGCDRPCAFCAIPLMRGGHVSTPIEQLVNQAKGLAAKGTRELILIAQDLTYYGIDTYGKRHLAGLLEQLSGVDGIGWIRLQYAYPSKFPMDVLPIIRDNPKICNYLDMPLQHISDAQLKVMRRGITKARTLELIDDIRRQVPEIALRTTLLVGHPGETDGDFDELLQFVKEYRFDRLGVFTYSHEVGTHAYGMDDNIPQDVKEARKEAIMEAQMDISMEKNAARIGQTLKVLVDRMESGYYVGRTEFDSPEVDNEVLINAETQYLRIGEFHQVRIADAMEYDLFGSLA